MKTRLLTTVISLIIVPMSFAQNNQTKQEVKVATIDSIKQSNAKRSSENIKTVESDAINTVKGSKKCVANNNRRKCWEETKYPTVLNYDFKTKTPDKVPFCTYNQFVTYRINNINRLLYNVKISSDQTTYQSEAPSGVSQMFNITKNETEVASKKTDSLLEVQTNNNKALVDSIKTKTNLEIQLAYNIQELSEIDDLQITQKNALSTKNGEITNRIDKINGIINDSKGFQLLNLNLLQQLHSSIIKVFKSYNHLENAKRINNELVAFSVKDIDFITSSERVNSILKAYPSIKYPELILSDFNNFYVEFTKNLSLYNQLLDKRINDKSSKPDQIQKDQQTTANLTSILNEITRLKSNVDNFDFSSLFASLNNILFELKKESNFFITSDPVQANKDVVNFKIDISPISRVNSASNLDQRNFSTTVPVVGGYKFDFSTGIFITSGLHDRQYRTVTVSKDTSIIAMNRNDNLVNISIGALMHISKRCNNNIKVGGSIGTGLSSSDFSKLNTFFGPCLIIGKQEQLIITAGIAISQVDYLKSKYTLNNPIANSEIDVTLTEKATRLGCFISFTYNLTSNKKE